MSLSHVQAHGLLNEMREAWKKKTNAKTKVLKRWQRKLFFHVASQLSKIQKKGQEELSTNHIA